VSNQLDVHRAVVVGMVLAAWLVVGTTTTRAQDDDGAAAVAPAGPPAPGAAAAGDAARAEQSSEYRTEAEAQLATLEREVARLREAADAGAAAKADSLDKRVRHFRGRLAGRAAPQVDAPELHVVGVYEAATADGARRGFREHPLGAASVEVTATDGPVVLVLCAYEPVKWQTAAARPDRGRLRRTT
jgi:hypothetical protein